jgi:hypothetical protein
MVRQPDSCASNGVSCTCDCTCRPSRRPAAATLLQREWEEGWQTVGGGSREEGEAMPLTRHAACWELLAGRCWSKSPPACRRHGLLAGLKPAFGAPVHDHLGQQRYNHGRQQHHGPVPSVHSARGKWAGQAPSLNCAAAAVPPAVGAAAAALGRGLQPAHPWERGASQHPSVTHLVCANCLNVRSLEKPLLCPEAAAARQSTAE